MSETRQKILIVDDEPVNLAVLADLLKSDYRVFPAKSGPQALTRVQDNPPDLVLLDVMMPEMDGYEVLRQLKADPATQDIPVMFVTALDSQDQEAKGLQLGALDYIAKPFNPAVVRARVRNLMTLVRQRKLLEHLANLDGLTEIPNRRSYEAALAREWRRCLRAGVSLSLAMFDIDCFKQYNDHYGHSAGDEALKAVAATLTAVVRRPGDLVCRYGGEEFVILMPETAREGAASVADEARKAVERLSIPHACSDAGFCLTITAGGATTLPTEISSSSELVCKADAMLYQAKRQGKNRLLWTPN